MAALELSSLNLSHDRPFRGHFEMNSASADRRTLAHIALTFGLLTAGCSGSPSTNDGSAGGTLSAGGTAATTSGGTASGGTSSSSSDSSPSGGTTQTNGSSGGGGSSQTAASTTTGGSSSTGGRSTSGSTATGGKASTGGVNASGGKAATGGANATGGKAGTGGANPTGGQAATGGSAAGGETSIGTQCTSALPSGASLVDTSAANTVIGTGTPASCTFSDLNAAVSKGGIIRFECGSAPHTIPITATMELPTDKDTVIDGGGTITLDGESKVRILRFEHPDWMKNNARVTLQRLKVINGKTTPTERIPAADPPCSQGWNDGEGGALYMRNGNLTVIDCTFSNNQAADVGPDTGGGAIYINGSKYGALIVGSTFTNNSASNAGAIGGLFAELAIYDSLFDHNTATGHDANNNEPDKCDAINNGQNQTGSGGNGGAIYQDGGSSTNVLLCGVQVTNNAAGTNAFGGGIFMTSNDWTGTITIRDSTITGNTGGYWTQLQEGSVTNLGTAFGINAKSATVSNSTLQQRN